MNKDDLKIVELEKKKKKDLQKALIEGENSGIVQNFNSKSHLKSLHQKKENENR